jgi:hypothetical protein
MDARLPIYSCVDGILPKAVDCVMPEVGNQGLITFVLVMLNTSCLSLAILYETSEEVHDVTFMHLNSHIGFEE